MWWVLGALAMAAPGAVDEVDEPERDGLLELDVELPSATPLIINGEEAGADDYAATVAIVVDLQFRYGGTDQHVYTFACTGTLIAPDTVLTAGHCVDSYVFELSLQQQGITLDDIDFAVSFEPDLTDYDGTQYTRDWPDDAVLAADYVGHEDFDIAQMQVQLYENNDIALIFLEEEVDDVDFVYLPTEAEAAAIEEDMDVFVVGWGQQENVRYGEQPESGTYAIKMMGASFINELEAYEFQVGAEEEDVRKCKGDSGGPTYAWYDDPETLRVIGVTSHSWGANPNTLCAEDGGVDTRVDHYLDWIDEQLRAACDDGVRSWCDEPGIPVPTSSTDTADTADTADTSGGGGDEGCGGCASGGNTGSFGLIWLAGVALLRRRSSGSLAE